MIALDSAFSTLTRLKTGYLFGFTMQLLNLPTVATHLLCFIRRVLSQIVSDDIIRAFLILYTISRRIPCYINFDRKLKLISAFCDQQRLVSGFVRQMNLPETSDARLFVSAVVQMKNYAG